MQRQKPDKPSPDFPLFAHASGRWAKKIKGKFVYFGPWENPAEALAKYEGREPAKVPDPARPAKPRKDYPLFAHASGRWAKKVRGKLVYFGPWADPVGAETKWLEQKDALLAGRKPRAATNGLSVGGLCNHFLNYKLARVGSRELKQRTYDDYKDITDIILEVFGKQRLVEDLQPDDFEKLRQRFTETHGPVAMLNDINRARVVFKYGADQFRIHPYYGKSFNRPTKAVLREAKNSMPKKLFNAPEIQELIDTAKPPLEAMILLGINCGFGNGDCAKLELRHLDLEGGRHSFPRPKTGIERRAPLWPETTAALKEAIRLRPKPAAPAHKDRVFLTAKGATWERTKENGSPISKEFAKLLKKLDRQETGRGFYSLRHTTQTIGDASGQSAATSFIMGHAPKSDDMAAIYREATFDDRIAFVVNFIREWALTRASCDPEHNPDQQSPSAGKPSLRLFLGEMIEEPLPSPDNVAG